LFLLLPLSGCLYQVREKMERTAAVLATQEFDRTSAVSAASPADKAEPLPEPKANEKGPKNDEPEVDVRVIRFLQEKDGPRVKDVVPPKLNVPPRIPGSEAPLIELPQDKQKAAAKVREIYPPLAPLEDYPKGAPGLDGRPYTLTDLHKLAAANSPTLKQAAADVEAARGNLIQARVYPNPTVGWEVDPNNNGSSAGVHGMYVDQLIKTGGKLKLQTAVAMMDLANAEIALKRARSDLATQVRTAYFNFLVARETLEVTRALATFTDEIYRLQANLLLTGFAAPYEPATLRAQANTARLAYRQAVQSYLYNWKQLAAAVGVRDLPLGEVAGNVDAVAPRYNYEAILAHVLTRHTDVLTTKNTIDKQRYNLKLAQVTPIPDVDVRLLVAKESTLPPFNWFYGLQVGAPLPIWDQNKGNVMAAEAALVRAIQEPKRVELNLVNGVAGAYASYRTALEAVQAYRNEILPDQVRAYRGVFRRRQVDPAVGFADLVTAQSALAGSVTTYLTALGQLWTAVVNLADFMQTDDLFRFAEAQALPPVGTCLPPASFPAEEAPAEVGRISNPSSSTPACSPPGVGLQAGQAEDGLKIRPTSTSTPPEAAKQRPAEERRSDEAPTLKINFQ
jgi:cobalt-zinc-cadmium efflux system outer membrane protein